MSSCDQTPLQPLHRQVFDALAEGIVWQAADGRVLDANDAAVQILGLSRDELLGRSSRDPRWYAVHEDGTPWPGEEHPAMLALRSGVPQRGQVMGILAPERGRRWIRIDAVPLPAADQGCAGVVASFVDVTDEVERTRALETANRELADLYEHAPCGYHMLDAQGRYVRINDMALQWLGCSRDEVLGRLGPADFMTEASRQTFREHFPRILAGEPVRGLAIDMVGRQGRLRHLQVDATPVLDAQGRFVATRGVLHDVTALRQSLHQLEQLTQNQLAVLDNDLVGIVRLQGRHVVWKNRAFDRMLGYQGDELIGLDTSVLYPDAQTYQRLNEAAYPVMHSGGVARLTLELLRKDGQRVWADCSGFMLDAQAGEAIWFSKDVTEQRQQEAQRLQAVQLEAQTHQLAETARLQRLFLSSVSHELRTPLNAVIGFSHVLRNGTVPVGSPKHGAYLEMIESAGRQLLGLVETMLDIAAAERGQLSFQARPLDMRAELAEVLALRAPKAAARGISLGTEVSPALGRLHLDPQRLRQLLLQYVDNAVKFSHPNGRVLVRVGPTEDGQQVRIEVEDQGIGIAPEDLPRLFQRFHKLSPDSTATNDGSGLGLWLAKLLVEAQGGQVGVRSTLGAGSVFSATLPRAFPLPAA